MYRSCIQLHLQPVASRNQPRIEEIPNDVFPHDHCPIFPHLRRCSRCSRCSKWVGQKCQHFGRVDQCSADRISALSHGTTGRLGPPSAVPQRTPQANDGATGRGPKAGLPSVEGEIGPLGSPADTIMMLGRDIWHTAKAMIECHGTDAAMESAKRAEKHLIAGDNNGAVHWHRIGLAVLRLQSLPTGDKSRH